MSSDLDLGQSMDEPPRKRRAAAVAAQKNWQMLSVPEDEAGADDADEDFIEITQVIKSAPNVTKVAQTSNVMTLLGRRPVVANPTVIDMNRSKRTPVADRAYKPHIASNSLKARKSFPTPPMIITRNQKPAPNRSRVDGPETVLIETDTSKRVILRTDGSNYRKPQAFKLVSNEPIDQPIVDGEEEIIVGTYEDDLLNDNHLDCDDTVEELSLLLFCESDNKLSKDKDKDDIQLIEVIDHKNNGKTQNKVQLKTIQPINNRRSGPQKGQSEPIDILEMDCENFDDEFADGLCFDCEEDILTESQWKQSMNKSKQYIEYSNCVKSSKRIKFLPEADVKEPVGIATTIISETTKVMTTPVHTRVNTRLRQQPITIQSVSGPIPSLVNQRTAAVQQISTQSQLPFTIIPVSTCSGVTNPLIIQPTFVNPSIGTNLQFFLQTPARAGPNQPTYVMLPRSSVPNGISQNILISNPSTVPNLNSNMRFSNGLQFRPNRAPNFRPQTALRVGRPPIMVRPVSTVSPSNQNIRIHNYSNINQTNANKTANSNPLFDCLTVYKGTANATKKIDMKNVLTIKPLPFSWPSNIDALINSLIKLDNALMKEKFKESPIAWMVNNNLILPPNCKACGIGVCNQVNKTLTSKNEYWHCNNPSCKRSFVIDRPRIFQTTKYDIPVSKLLFLIYYWSIQVDVEDLIKTGQIEMGIEKIFNVWVRLQKVCSLALQSKDTKLGPIVEICSIQVGRFHVLGAMERSTRRVKLAVVPIYEIIQKNGRQTVMLPFIKWLSNGCLVYTCEQKFTALTQYGIKVIVQTKSDFLAQNRNLSLNTISGYMIHHFQRFFKDMDLSTLSNDILSNILDELLWRERYGNNPFTAFYNIIKHISEQCGLRKPHCPATIIQTNIPTGIRTPTATVATKARTVSQTSDKQMPRVHVIQSVSTLNETNSIFVDEYYYSSLTLKTSVAKTISQEESAKDSIQCHLCQMFFDNILIVKHLVEHFEKERRGRVRKGDNNEPECKHCLRFYSNRALHLHEELSNTKMIPYSCRICLLPMLARQPFITHMKTTHFSGEMPYYCDICSFRSSFQKSLSDHFEASHSNSSQVMCPYCIRIFDVTKFKNLSSFLYRHLTTHYAVASVYDCDKCVLTFTTKLDLKDHCFKGHNPSNAIDEKFDITPFKVEDKDKSVCTRAKEQELFTPFLPNFEDNPDFGPNSSLTEPTSSGETDAFSFEISCEPNITDFLSIEPDIHMDMADGYMPFVDLILPVDCDYSDDQLKNILTNSFDTNQSNETADEVIEGVEPNHSSDPIPDPNPEPSPEAQKYYILSNNERVVCCECRTQITTDHFSSLMVCEKCNFTSHCKTSYEGHTTDAHPIDSSHECKQISVLKTFSELVSYKTICKHCDFSTTDGNQIALHMIKYNHLDIVCKPMDYVTKTDESIHFETESDLQMS